MNTSKIRYLGPHIKKPEQFEEGKTILNTEQHEVLKTLSYVLGNGYDNHLEGLLPHYTFKGLVDWLGAQTRTLLTNQTITADQAYKSYGLIEKLISRS